MQAVLDAVSERLMTGDESLIRVPEICEATGVNYGSVYHHFGSREGVIDAAYDAIFSRLIEEDIELFRANLEQADSFEEFVARMQPIVASLSAGPNRRSRRAMRVRVVAAASTRPQLRVLIGQTQARLTEEMRQLIDVAQRRGWVRSDISSSALAVFLQIILFGRTLDDVSISPIDEAQWEHAMSLLFVELLPH